MSYPVLQIPGKPNTKLILANSVNFISIQTIPHIINSHTLPVAPTAKQPGNEFTAVLYLNAPDNQKSQLPAPTLQKCTPSTSKKPIQTAPLLPPPHQDIKERSRRIMLVLEGMILWE